MNEFKKEILLNHFKYCKDLEIRFNNDVMDIFYKDEYMGFCGYSFDYNFNIKTIEDMIND